MALDINSLVILTYETGSSLIEHCEAAKQCHAESGRIAVRTVGVLGALESAVVEFSGDVGFEARLIKLKRVLDQATDLIERCKKPAKLRDVASDGRVKQFQAELHMVEEELERLITDLNIPMLTDIKRATEKITKAFEDIKAREGETSVRFDEEALALAVQDGIRRELNARDASGLPVRDVIKSNVMKAQEPDGAVPSTAGHLQTLGKSGKSRSAAGRLGRVRFDTLKEGMILGEGAFGIVLSGTYKGDEVAIKKARGSIGDPEVLKHFRREVEIYFSMRHPNIVRVLAFSVNNPEHPPCLVMELMEKSLYNHLGAHETPPPLVDRLGVLHDVCKGLRFLHERGIVHRDVKSPNVLIDTAGTAKLSNVGLAAVNSSIARSTGFPSCRKVRSDVWMAPEVQRGGDATSASDIFSFSIVMWEVICHRTVGAEVPIGEELLSSTATKIHVITRTPNPPQQQIQDLLDRCSRRNSEERPGINTVAEDLKAILSAAVAITDAPPTTNDGSCGATKDVTSRSTSAPSKPPRAALTPPGASPSSSVLPKSKDDGDVDTTVGPATVASTVIAREEAMAGRVTEASDNAKAVAVIAEGELMKKDDSGEWYLGYFRLFKEGYFAHYPADDDGDSKALLALTPHSVTTYTNVESCFTVKTGEEVWFLMAADDDIMDGWMSIINIVIIDLFRNMYNVPEDNYWNQGLKGRFFYRMNKTALPQWIRAFPEESSPRTGDGVFPGDAIEVSQVLSNNGHVLLRIAGERGWVTAENSEGDPVFTEVKGTLTKDTQTYRVPPSSEDPTPILFGPSLDSQQTGEACIQGELAEAADKFTLVDGSGIAFIKLADGRGWVPVKSGSNSGVTPVIT